MNAMTSTSTGGGFSVEQRKRLADRLDPSFVRTRDQAGQKLSYVEAWQVIAVANEIFGADGWDRETVLLERTVCETYVKTKFNQQTRRKDPVIGPDGEPARMHRVGYLAKVRVTVRAGGLDIVREGTGYGSGTAEDPNLAFEGAVKEAESDAMKRALMTLGNPFGLALYDKQQANVGTPEYIIAAELEKATEQANAIIARLDAAPTLPELGAAWKAVWPEISELPEQLRTLITKHKDGLKAAFSADGTKVAQRGSLANPFAAVAAE